MLSKPDMLLQETMGYNTWHYCLHIKQSRSCVVLLCYNFIIRLLNILNTRFFGMEETFDIMLWLQQPEAQTLVAGAAALLVLVILMLKLLLGGRHRGSTIVLVSIGPCIGDQKASEVGSAYSYIACNCA